jgi:hypothetical protein
MSSELAAQLAQNPVPIPPRIRPSIGSNALSAGIGRRSAPATTGIRVVRRRVPLAVHTVIDDESDAQVS